MVGIGLVEHLSRLAASQWGRDGYIELTNGSFAVRSFVPLSRIEHQLLSYPSPLNPDLERVVHSHAKPLVDHRRFDHAPLECANASQGADACASASVSVYL